MIEEKILLKMADLCSRSEQCSADIRQKLLRKGMSSSQTADLLRRLEEQRFIDDARFARAFASDKVRFSAWGKMKIRMALRQKRISSADIDSALEAVEEADFSAAAERASRSASAGLDAADFADRQKFCRRMLSKGFESEIVNKALKAWRDSLC